jgi:hypothetical protein
MYGLSLFFLVGCKVKMLTGFWLVSCKDKMLSAEERLEQKIKENQMEYDQAKDGLGRSSP